MTETERIADQMRRAFEGEAWHGPAVEEILNGITEEQALARPIACAHTICELVLHMAAWKSAVADWLEGSTREVTDAENFPMQGDWGAAVEGLRRAHERVLRALPGLDDSRLDQRLSARKHSAYTILHGILQHDLYHAGQIQILKRATISRP